MVEAPLQKNSLKLKTQDIISRMNRYKYLYLLALPGLLYFLIFQYYPLYFLKAAFVDFNPFKGLDGSEWIGLANFSRLFTATYFKQAFNNTLILSFLNRVIAFPVPILLAILMNEIANEKFKRTVQTFIYLPHFLSWVIVYGVFVTLLSPSGGIVNQVLMSLHIISEPIYFFIEKSMFRGILVASQIWKEAGWQTIVYLAAITSIDATMYEAARIDGANRLKQITKITIPTILPTIIVVFVLSIAKVLNIFEQVFVFYNPTVAAVSETIDTYAYQVGVSSGDVSFGVTVGLFKNIVSLILILLANKAAKRIKGSEVF